MFTATYTDANGMTYTTDGYHFSERGWIIAESLLLSNGHDNNRRFTVTLAQAITDEIAWYDANDSNRAPGFQLIYDEWVDNSGYYNESLRAIALDEMIAA